jgi:hypothetical protein
MVFPTGLSAGLAAGLPAGFVAGSAEECGDAMRLRVGLHSAQWIASYGEHGF